MPRWRSTRSLSKTCLLAVTGWWWEWERDEEDEALIVGMVWVISKSRSERVDLPWSISVWRKWERWVGWDWGDEEWDENWRAMIQNERMSWVEKSMRGGGVEVEVDWYLFEWCRPPVGRSDGLEMCFRTKVLIDRLRYISLSWSSSKQSDRWVMLRLRFESTSLGNKKSKTTVENKQAVTH